MTIKSLFKRKPSVAKIAATIEKIHGEFDSASEKLLNEAKEIISRNKDADKGSRLSKLGFGMAAPVSQSKENAERKRLADKIEYYQQWYPNNKFITEDAVKAICGKYGLMFGDAAYYKGDVPEKNLAEMEAFKLLEKDMERRSNIDDYHDMLSIRMRFGSLAQSFGPSSHPDYYQSSPPRDIRHYTIKKPFKICAPEKDFDTRFLAIKDGYKLEYDPIVLQPVNMGYLIVTKWGLEASDPIAQNPKDN